MFEATLYTADPDHQRLQRLTLAAAIALTATTTALASMWTLDRLQIDRLSGPVQQFELLQMSLLPPKIVEPPPPPPADGGEAGGVTTEFDRDEPEPRDELIEVVGTKSENPTPRSNTGGSKQGGIPGLTGSNNCPGGVCGGPLTGISSPCPQCVISDFPVADKSPPKEVEFSALKCLACADPDRAALRKTMASVQGREGRVVVRFCVDGRGRVEPNSIAIKDSYGDAAVDRIVRTAIAKWRFSPMKVGNQPRRACSSATFNIRFD